MKLTNICVSVVAPMWNEEEVIHTYVQEVLDVLSANFLNYELLLVDDGSTDATVLKCLPFIQKNPHVGLLALSRNFGHEIASTAG